MKQLLLLAVAALTLQAADYPEYVYQSTTTAVTIQRPSAANKQLKFIAAWITCAADQTATLSWNGTAATATSAVPVKLPGAPPAQAVAYTGSNVGGGTTGPTYAVAATPGAYVIDLTPFTLGSTGNATNLTISTTGSCSIAITWKEQ